MNTVPSCREPGLGKLGRNLAASEERVLRNYLVNLMHQIKRCRIKPNRRVIDR